MSQNCAAHFAPFASPDTETGLGPTRNRASPFTENSTPNYPTPQLRFRACAPRRFRVPAKRGFRVLWKRRRCVHRGCWRVRMSCLHEDAHPLRQERQGRPAATKASVFRAERILLCELRELRVSFHAGSATPQPPCHSRTVVQLSDPLRQDRFALLRRA